MSLYIKPSPRRSGRSRKACTRYNPSPIQIPTILKPAAKATKKRKVPASRRSVNEGGDIKKKVSDSKIIIRRRRICQ